MMRYMRLGIFLIILIVTGGLLVTAQDGERLNNPDLEEGSFGPYTTRRGGEFPIYLPPSWNVWLAASTGEFLNRGDRTTINPHPGPAPDPHQGSRALSIDCGYVTCTVAIYQQISVQPDQNIQASAWAQVKACNLAPDAETCGSAVESGAQTRIGIDPNGGTDPNDGDVVWSGFIQPHDRWEQMTISATTTGTTATLFLYSQQGSTADINKTYWDQTNVTGGGQGGSVATNIPPTPTPIPEVPFVVPQNERPDGSIVHVVSSGDTLDSIAYAYQTSRTALLELNSEIRGNGGYIRIGQEILVRPPQQQPTAIPEPSTEETAPPEVSSPSINPGGEMLASIVQVGAFGNGSGTILIGQSPGQPSFDLTLLPQLGAPDDMVIDNTDTSAEGRQTAITTTTIITDLTAEQVAEVFNEQLTTAGWLQVAAEATASFAMSNWSFSDITGRTWGATLSVTASPTNPGQYTALLFIKETGQAANAG